MLRYTRSMGDKEPVSYTLLLVVIIIGVTIGNLLSNWATGQYAAYQMQKAVEQAGRVFPIMVVQNDRSPAPKSNNVVIKSIHDPETEIR